MSRSSTPDLVVPAARVAYRNDQPYSLDYRDIYHAADGAAEVERVFIAPCRLDELAAERARLAAPADTVRVGELGFGSGLNFAVAAERCLAAGARLHFVSCEARPLDAADFEAIARERRSRHPLYAELAARYPPRLAGWHRRTFAGGRIRLQLWLGEAAEALADLADRQRQPIDAWFLDGFAPDRNPELWEPALFRRVAALSTAGTRVATFTAAGRVRRGLTEAGFTMRRVDQRPHKRESLAGTFADRGLEAADPPRRVTVAGAGIAGAAVAAELAAAGVEVRLLDPELGAPASGRPSGEIAAEGRSYSEGPGSRMPVTVLHARLLPDASPAAALRAHGYLLAADRVRDLTGFAATGALQLPADAEGAERLRRVAERFGGSGAWLGWRERADAAALADWPVPDGGLWLPGGGTVNLPTLIATLTANDRIERVSEPLQGLDTDEPVILACGIGTHAFAPTRYLEIAPIAGQLDVVAADHSPRLPVVGRGYLAPTPDGLLAAGSTYEHRPWDPDEATRTNLAQLEGRTFEWRYRCRGIRTVSSDRTAIAGPLFDADGRVVPHCYVSTGHGSAGNVSAHLAAAVVTAQIMGDCPPLARPLEALLSPQRFRIRQARRGFRHHGRP